MDVESMYKQVTGKAPVLLVLKPSALLSFIASIYSRTGVKFLEQFFCVTLRKLPKSVSSEH